MSSKCTVCFGASFASVYSSKFNFSVTSDNQIIDKNIELFKCDSCGHLQKFPDFNVLNEIYSKYTTNSLLPLDEQIKFDTGVGKKRSSTLLENCGEFLPAKGDMLDIGSGNGAILKAMSEKNNSIKLYAHDLNDNNIADISAIHNFCKFYTDLEDIEQRFDIISAIHVLEHVSKTSNFLEKIKTLLKPRGVLLIQVPNISQNPFDIFVYDHISHFDNNHLFSLLSNFFTCLIFPDKQIYKEITIIATDSANFISNKVDTGILQNRFSVPFLNEIFTKIEAVEGEVSVFGSSPVCTFFGAVLGSRLKNFYDEDMQKQGKMHIGVKVLAPEEYSGEHVLLLFVGDIASTIKNRLKHIKFVDIGNMDV